MFETAVTAHSRYPVRPADFSRGKPQIMLQDMEGLKQLRHAFLVKKAKTEVIRLVFLYIKRVSDLQHTPQAAEEAKAAFRHVSKSDDTNNARKVRASGDLLLLSWMHQMSCSCLLDGTLLNEPWEFDSDTRAEMATAIQTAVDTVKKVGETQDSKSFRGALRTAIKGLAVSDATGPVRPKPPTTPHAYPPMSCMNAADRGSCGHTAPASVQALRALSIEWAKGLENDKTLEVFRANKPTGKFTVGNAKQYEALQGWGGDWGPLADNGEASPLGFWHDDRLVPTPQHQKDRKLLTEPDDCNLAKLLRASGENAPAGFILFRELHNLLIWQVPLPECAQESHLISKPENEDLSADTLSGAAEDAKDDIHGGPSFTAVVPKTAVDVEVVGPRCGYINVAGALMLSKIVPYVVRSLTECSKGSACRQVQR